MEVEIFTICDHAQDLGGKLFIIGTFDTLFAQEYPLVHPNFSIAGRLRFSEKELGTRQMKLIVTDPNGKNLVNAIEGQIQISKPNSIADYVSTNFVINLNQIKFDLPGLYKFELHIDGEWKTGLKLNAVKQ